MTIIVNCNAISLHGVVSAKKQRITSSKFFLFFLLSGILSIMDWLHDHEYISENNTISELGSGIGRSAILMHLYSGQSVVGYERSMHRVTASNQLKKKAVRALCKDFRNM